MYLSHLGYANFPNEPCTDKTKQNLKAKTAEMKQGALKAVKNLIEFSQTVKSY